MPTSNRSGGSSKEAEITRLIDECTWLLQKDPSCLRSRAIRGHACMKAKVTRIAGCYNTEGEFSRAIQDYTIALKFDEHGHDKGFGRGESRLYLHETAEKAINDKLSLSYRTRDTANVKPPAGVPPPRPVTTVTKDVGTVKVAPRQPVNFRTSTSRQTQCHTAAVPSVARVKIDLTKKQTQPDVMETTSRHHHEYQRTTGHCQGGRSHVKRVTVAL
ncbi:hypothetical protein DYB26_002365 [Aphanomyces astaci]|uniref:Uncharacterized protein n=1 Tax=Aphanomyces astaci TaxID=112090 RepID=A0A397BYU5_APHAT|nr:hypothetical protein DYB38_013567 [Aphanomyces astaci]RHY73039.1 hypothetical protein DYB34_013302 [Aphanomyces astaci]RHZ27148.1 hypothetical protein DYB26_002365 [Aphanomyces astaci]